MKRMEWLMLFALILPTLFATSTYAESPREQLTQMVAQLRNSPNDTVLREKIIRLAQEIKPAPAVPDTAVEFEGRAQFAFKNAKSNDDYLAAAREYEKAVTGAPWVSGYYSDLCTIYEKAGKFEDAKRNCELSLIGLADSAQITDVKRRIAGLKYGIEQKAQEKEKNSIEGFWKKTDLRALYRQGSTSNGQWEGLPAWEQRYPHVYEIRKTGSKYEVVGIRSNYIALKTSSADDHNIQFLEIPGAHNVYRYICRLDGADMLCSLEIVRDQRETITRAEIRFSKQAHCERLGPDDDQGTPIQCR